MESYLHEIKDSKKQFYDRRHRDGNANVLEWRAGRNVYGVLHICKFRKVLFGLSDCEKWTMSNIMCFMCVNIAPPAHRDNAYMVN